MYQVRPGCDLYHVLYNIPYPLKASASTTATTPSKSSASNGTKTDAASSSSSTGGQVGVASAVADPSKHVDLDAPLELEKFLQYVADAADR